METKASRPRDSSLCNEMGSTEARSKLMSFEFKGRHNIR